eukprot:gene25661-28993_t
MSVKDKKFAEVDEAIVTAAMAGNVNFHSNPKVQLRSLNSAQLCRLFDYCLMYHLGDFILRNELIGIDLEDGIDTIEDLMELGLNKPKAKVLLKRIIEWKEDGLPADFHITEPSASTAVDPVKTNIQHHGFAPDAAQNVNVDVVMTEEDDNYAEEKQLDDDF